MNSDTRCGENRDSSNPMSDLLTTKELQALLDVDRKTVYRMLKDGKLPAVRVGGQWRFPRQAIAAWLHEPNPSENPALRLDDTNNEVLPPDCLAAIQDIFAEAMHVGAVTTDLEGKPLSNISNSCAFCQLVLASPEGRKRCQESWGRLSNAPHAPQVEVCHAGLGYARARIQVADEFVAMVFAGQFLPGAANEKRTMTMVRTLARECAISESELCAAIKQVHVVEPAHADKLLQLLEKLAATFSQIGRRRLELLIRLRRVAQIVSI